jgi:hypothetical protein
MSRKKVLAIGAALIALLAGACCLSAMRSSLQIREGDLYKAWGPFHGRAIAKQNHFIEAEGGTQHAFFVYPATARNRPPPMDIWVCSVDGTIMRRFRIGGDQLDPMNAIARAHWVGGSMLVAEGHINPTTSRYFVVSAKDGTVTGYTGSEFALSPDGNTAVYVQRAPHFSAEKTECRIVIGQETIATVTGQHDSPASIYWAADSRSVVVIFNPNTGKRGFLATRSAQGEWLGQWYVFERSPQ